MVERYWGDERFYHHTAPITMNYAIREALRLICEEAWSPLCPAYENHRALPRRVFMPSAAKPP